MATVYGRVRDRTGEQRDHRDRDRRHPDARAHLDRERDDDRRDHPDRERRDAQAGHEVRRSAQEDACHRGARQDGGRQRDAAQARPLPQRPHVHHARADEGRDGRHQRDRVVAVDDPGHEAEHEPGHERASRPTGGTRHGGSPSAAARPRMAMPATRAMSANGSSHATWPPNSALKSRRMPGRAAEAARPAAAAGTRHAEDAAQAVVAKDEVERGVRRAPADEGARGGRGELHGGDPPGAAHEDGDERRAETRDPAAHPAWCGDRPDEGEDREDEPGLEELRVEREADEDGREDRPADPAVLQPAQEGAGREDQEEREEGVGVVVPEDEDRDGHDRHDDARDRRRDRPKERRTIAKRMATVAMPQRASGSRMLQEDSPKVRTDRPMSIVASGGLSTVMKFAESIEPKNHAVQLCEPASAAAE